jgi:hypothetical protein
MIEVFKNKKTPKVRVVTPSRDDLTIGIEGEIDDVLQYLHEQENYAIVGENAVHIHTGEHSYTLPFEVVGSLSYPGGLVSIMHRFSLPRRLLLILIPLMLHIKIAIIAYELPIPIG